MHPCAFLSPAQHWVISSTTDIPFYTELAQSVSGDILEIGANPCRIAPLIATLGKRIIAMDTQFESFQETQRQWQSDGGGNGPLYLVADIRNPCLSATFELILATQRVFERFLLDTERIRVFKDCASFLASAGLLVVHVWGPPSEADLKGKQKIEEIPPSEKFGRLRVTLTEECDLSRKVRRYRKKIEELEGEKKTWECEPVELRWYNPTDLESLGLRAGLKIDKRFSDFQKTPYAPGARELIWIYRKR